MTANPYKSTLVIQGQTPDRQYRSEIGFSAEGSPVELEVDVPDSTTDLEVTCQIDKDKLKLLLMIADTQMTVETNDGTSPTDTITLGGSKELVYAWTDKDQDTCKITADVTKLFLTNSSGAAGVFTLLAVQDVTPGA